MHAGRTNGTRRKSHVIALRAGASLGLVLASSLCACAPDASEQRANVLFVVVDTLRADALGCYGATVDASPSIDALAARGVRFETAQSVAPWTMPSVATHFTGLYPSKHGVIDPTRALPPEALTLAETFQGAGYSTGAVVSHDLIGARTGYDQGFALFDESQARGHEYVSTAGVTRIASEMLGELASGTAPFFLFVHYFDPHYEYVPHPEFGFAGAPVGRLDGQQSIGDLRSVMHELTAPELRYLRAVYDEEVRFTDDGIGKLLGEVERLGLADNTVVVLSADHGEELVEHGWLGHTQSLYQPVARVPLVVAAPRGGRRGAVVSMPVSSVSVAPTILELAGVDGSAHGFQGESLAGFVRGTSDAYATAVVTEVAFLPLNPDGFVRKAFKQALVRGEYKVVHDDEDGRAVLYDLARDGGELSDLASARPAVRDELLGELRAALERIAAEPLPILRRNLSPALLQRLIELGYANEGFELPSDKKPDDESH